MLVVTPAGDVGGLSRGRLLDLVVVVAVVVVDEGVGLEDGECKNLCSSLRTHTRTHVVKMFIQASQVHDVATPSSTMYNNYVHEY